MARKVPAAGRKPVKSTRETLLGALAERDREIAERDRQLTEARARQSATAEILRIISRSPNDARPVFESIVLAAAPLLRCDLAFVLLCDHGFFWTEALASAEGLLSGAELGRTRIDPAGNYPSRAILAKEMLYLPDWSLVDRPPHEQRVHQLYGVTCSLYLPLLRGEDCVGLLTLVGKRPHIFGPDDIIQAQAFRDQALIAIENARLFNETKEALERQTAAAEILRVISSSPTDLQPVFDAIARSASELCEGSSSQVFLYRNGVIDIAAHHKTPDEALTGALSTFPSPPHPGTASGRAILGRAVIHIPDIAADPDYSARSIVKAGIRTVLSVPMLRNDEPIGVINATRTYSRPYTDGQIELLKTFADQAVIAINNVGLFNETQEALKQQTATADVLKVISRSAFDPQAVLEALINSAVSLSGSSNGMIWRYENGAMHASAFARGEGRDDFIAHMRAHPQPPGRGSTAARVAQTGEVHNIPDVRTEPDYSEELRRVVGTHAALGVPMKRDEELVGAIVMSKPEAGAYPARIVELVKTFADQAVIAIENARLFQEVQTRTRDLEEALQQQTAAAEVLKVISRSAFDLKVVLDTLVQSAAKLCDADQACFFQRKGDLYHFVSNFGFSPELVAYAGEHPFAAGPGSTTSRVALEARTIHDPDVLADPNYIASDHQRLGNDRTNLGVPLLREGAPIGVFILTRRQVRPFTDRQIELVQTFADQAVIAIENVRLFDEVQARTRDLTEALRQQTATAEVLKVISRSAFDLQAVFDALLGSAVTLAGADSGVLAVRDGDVFRAKSLVNKSPDLVRFLTETPITPGPGSVMGRVALSGQVEWIEDTLADSALAMRNVIARTNDDRALVGVPLLRDGHIEGGIVLGRREPGRFGERAIELAQTFADQAVIAIQNVRLFDEVQARTRDLEELLQQQTATADVLKAISRTAFDLETVLETLISTAVRLCNGSHGQIFRRHGDVYRYGASQMEVDPAYRRHEQTTEIRPGRGTLIGRVALENWTVSIADAWNDPEYAEKAEARTGDVRAMLGVPLMRGSEPIGAFALARSAPVPFTRRQVELVTTFADQAVIAIENVRLFDEVQARTRDLSELLQQQTATADVLKVISRSAFDLQAVFDTLIASAVELCGANRGAIFLRDGDVFPLRAASSSSPEYFRYWQTRPARAGRGSATARVILSGKIESIPDVLADAEMEMPANTLVEIRATLGVPLLRNNQVEGVLVLTRPQPGVFTPRQVDLVQTFADQAVIAIENARLFDEVKARTDDLSEALRQQTATADVLKVISRSAFDLHAVLDTLTRSAATLCNASRGVIYLRDGDVYRAEAAVGGGDEYLEFLKANPRRPGRESVVPRVAVSGAVEQIPDVLADAEFRFEGRMPVNPNRALVGVPLLREGRVDGVFVLSRAEPGAFSPRQVELLRTFADQAVIAIENVRLFQQVQARTRDLSEALQQQTATADVLKVISRSAFGLKTVLQTLVDSAVRLCASDGVIYLRDGDAFRAQAVFGAKIAGHDPRNRSPRRPGRDSVTGRVALSGQVEQIPDNQADPEFKVAPAQRMNMRALLGVPLLRDGEVEGVFTLGKPEPGLFSDRAVELVRTFADQAVIAIQNVRLFDAVQAKTRDLEESLQLQTATADVLKVISRSAFDLDTIFRTLVTTAVDLSKASSGTLCVRDGDLFRYRGMAGPGSNPDLQRYLEARPLTTLGRDTIAGRAILSRKVEQIPDIRLDENYAVPLAAHGNPGRALLGVPLLGKTQVEGAIVLTRAEPGAYSPREIEILQTFADQAVIAIENVRLFEEVQARTRELAASLDDLRRTQDRLIQSEKLASLGQLTAGIAHEIKNPLNFVNNFSALSRELIDELGELLEKAPLQQGQREEAGELIGMVASNLDKVVQHGKRADSIVKNMLLHSREGSGERSSVNINAMVEEALNLAYHGARAEKPGFNVTIAKSLDPGAGAADLYPQEMTRVLLNLISNGFYATTKRKQSEANGAYEPTISASTRDLGDSVEIAIRDNGTGIPEEVRAKMFNPFFTTKPAGEGTGLGLSLSHDIVVKQHGGAIEVSTEPGAYTRFRIVLPRESRGSDAK